VFGGKGGGSYIPTDTLPPFPPPLPLLYGCDRCKYGIIEEFDCAMKYGAAIMYGHIARKFFKIYKIKQ
jgi:hypothetical protein